MKKNLKRIRCSGCDKLIWRKDIEGWCYECRVFYTACARKMLGVSTED